MTRIQTFLRRIPAAYFAHKATRQWQAGKWMHKHYTPGSFGHAKGDLHLAFAALYMDLAEAFDEELVSPLN